MNTSIKKVAIVTGVVLVSVLAAYGAYSFTMKFLNKFYVRGYQTALSGVLAELNARGESTIFKGNEAITLVRKLPVEIKE